MQNTYIPLVKVNLNANLSPDFTVRILLVFARDGLDDADELATAFDNFTPPDCPNIKVNRSTYEVMNYRGVD